ncbi:MAG TPA: ABC transporter permease, partial [Candidatus Korarchaeota archaeon]|nr:ABC transporter permease [Candidatus Korarchaeota archaeon]
MSVEEYSLKGIIKELLSYKSAIVGFAILAFLVGISIYSLTMTPYSKAGQLWNDQEIWLKYPRNAAPEWVNYFSSKKLPPNIVLGEGKPGHKKEVKKEGGYVKIMY